MRTEANDTQIYYHEHGNKDNESIVLIHGLGASLDIWYPVAKILRNNYHVLRYDIRGAGQSKKPDGEYSLDTWSNDLAELLKQKEIEQAHIIGHSLGAMIALRFGLDRPEKTLSLVLAGALIELPEEVRGDIKDTMQLVREKGLEPTAKMEEIKLAFAPRTIESHPEILGLHRGFSLSGDPQGYVHQCEGLLNASLSEEVGEIDVPTLLLVGSHDVITPLKLSREISEKIRESRIEVIADAGHMSMIERPQKFSELTLSFLLNL